MAHAAGTSARTHRLIALAAALLLAATTALAFGRVFLGAATTLRLVGAAIAAACLAVVFERRGLLLSTAASGIGLVFAIGLVVFPETTWYGLPTADTLRAAMDAAALVGEQARIQPAPAEPTGPLLLAAVVSLWAAVFSAHALAFRAGSPLLGLVPPVAFVAFADTVLEEFVKPLYGLAFLAAALLVVFADGLARVQGWGPVWTSGRRGIAATAGRGARRLAFTALGAALLAPIIVPGFGSKGLVDFGTPAADRVAIDPFVSIQQSLDRANPVETLLVEAEQPGYIRLVTLPDFDGVGWQRVEDTQGGVVSLGEQLPGAGRGDATTATIEVVTTLAQNYLPAPSPLLSIESVPGRTVRFDPSTQTAFVDSPLERDDTYTRDDIGRATHGGGAAERPVLRPPRRRSVHAGPRRLAPADQNPRARVDSGHLQRLRQGRRHRGTPPLRGFPVQGRRPAPIRTALDPRVPDGDEGGVLPTVRDVDGRDAPLDRHPVARGRRLRDRGAGGGGRYSFTTEQAHAWVEVYFPGWGWMPFEPTPGRVNAMTYVTPLSTHVPAPIASTTRMGAAARRPARDPERPR